MRELESSTAIVSIHGGDNRPIRISESGSSPASYLQEALWLRDQTAAPISGLHIFVAAKIPAGTDLQVCEDRLNAIVRANAAFRTTFRLYESKEASKRRLGQVVSEPSVIAIPRFDISGSDDVQTECDRISSEFIAQPFDLACGPLLRAALLTLGEQEQVLLVSAHRIVLDERSLNDLVSQVTARQWEIKAAGQYVNFALRQRQAVDSDTLARQMSYWKNQLRGSLPALDLPVDYPRAANPIVHFRSLRLPLDRLADERMVALSAAAGCSPYDLFIACAQVMMYHYTRQEDMLIGDHSATDRPSGFENSFGPFRNTLLLRTDLSGNPTFRELLERVRTVRSEAQQNDGIPCEAVVAELAGDPAAPMPYQVAVELCAETDAANAGCDEGNLELALCLVNGRHDTALMIRYAAKLFAPETIARLLDHLRNVIVHAVLKPDDLISDVRPMSPEEERRILFDWNRTELEYPRDVCLHHLFERQAGATPEAIALTFEGRHTTYRELNAQSNRLAHHLRTLGAGADILVGILIERSPEMLISLLAVLKAGAAYVPLDPSYPADRIEFMVTDSHMTILVTQEALSRQLTRSGIKIVCLDSMGSVLDAHPVEAPQNDTHPEHLAYVIYTSGSTGKPKGVQIPHRAAVNFMYSMQAEPGIRADDSLLAVTTLSFDIAGLEMHLPLMVGARIVLAPRAVTSDGSRLLHLLNNSGITVMQATPATWRLLIDSGWEGHRGLKILCGGEALPRDLASELLSRCQALWNMYGPTETTIWSTVHRVDSPDSPIYIGHPIGNTQVYVLDKNQRPVPIGAPGELHIGGDGVARGYLNRPELTGEKFIPDPFSEVPGARMYRTGDLVRYRPGGDIEFSGRLDHQVKIRGFRIELGEIETALSRHPEVRQSVVVARDDGRGSKRLAAYVIPASSRISIKELREFLKASLPDHMVPATFTFIESFPLTPNGKVDRRALPDPALDRPDLGAPFVEPRTRTETKLAAIWQNVLGLSRVGINDNFFELGADSLMTARVFAQISKHFGKDLPPTLLFRTSTVAGLAALLDREGLPESHSCLVPIRTQGRNPPLFCIHGGAGTILFYHDLTRHLGSEQPVYALQAQGLYGEAAPMRTVEEMASHYVRLIQQVQPAGPYYFVGYCFGIIIGLEIAQQLKQRGEETGLLASLNGPCPLYDNGPESWESDALEANMAFKDRMTYESARLAKLSLRGKAAYVYKKVVEAVRWRQKALWMMLRIPHKRKDLLEYRYKRYVTKGKPLPPSLRDSYFLDNTYRAERQYRPTKFEGDMVIFRGRGLYADPFLGWQDLIDGGIEVHDIPGNHGHHRHIVEEPAVGLLAEQLSRCIDERLQRRPCHNPVQ